eukprot:452745-Pleurochrysis_carterae.AAC.1
MAPQQYILRLVLRLCLSAAVPHGVVRSRAYVVGVCWHRRVESGVCVLTLDVEGVLVDAADGVYPGEVCPAAVDV